jgi:hypothetical protein
MDTGHYTCYVRQYRDQVSALIKIRRHFDAKQRGKLLLAVELLKNNIVAMALFIIS